MEWCKDYELFSLLKGMEEVDNTSYEAWEVTLRPLKEWQCVLAAPGELAST